MRKKVLIGLSGGVDSSVAAYLLKEQGYEVIAATLKLWQNATEIEDARAVADKLDLPFYVFDFTDEFEDEVVKYFAREYMEGRTPNPCLICNKKIKWELLLKKAGELGCDYIATGHYASLSCDDIKASQACFDSSPQSEMPLETDEKDTHEYCENAIHLKCAPQGKDQTYALCYLTKEMLARTLMPLGAYTKAEVREIAARIGLPTASKSDSQDICFIPDGDYASFLRNYIAGEKLGEAVDGAGRLSNCEAEEEASGLSDCEEGVDASELSNFEAGDGARRLSDCEAEGDASKLSDCEAGVDASNLHFDEPGNFVNKAGDILGVHKGIIHYTVGQRRGLGISAPRSLYVLEIRPRSNEVVLGYEEEVFKGECYCESANWLVDVDSLGTVGSANTNHCSDAETKENTCATPSSNTETKENSNVPENTLSAIEQSNNCFRAFVKIRYNHVGEMATVFVLGDSRIRIEFDKPVKGVAPGQAAVFYKDGEMLGGAVIASDN